MIAPLLFHELVAVLAHVSLTFLDRTLRWQVPSAGVLLVPFPQLSGLCLGVLFRVMRLVGSALKRIEPFGEATRTRQPGGVGVRRTDIGFAGGRGEGPSINGERHPIAGCVMRAAK